jgi:hypothetical protein
MSQANRTAEQSSERWIAAAEEVAKGAAQAATEAGVNVQDKLGAADETVRDYTGKPLGAWTEDLRAFMRERPLTGAAAMIVAGYMAARICAVALRPR